MVNDEDIAKQMTFEKMCASGGCSSMPAKQKMQIKVCLTLHNNYFYPIFKICQSLLYSFIMTTLSMLTLAM